jgi:hypothetical protein
MLFKIQFFTGFDKIKPHRLFSSYHRFYQISGLEGYHTLFDLLVCCFFVDTLRQKQKDISASLAKL